MMIYSICKALSNISDDIGMNLATSNEHDSMKHATSNVLVNLFASYL